MRLSEAESDRYEALRGVKIVARCKGYAVFQSFPPGAGR